MQTKGIFHLPPRVSPTNCAFFEQWEEEEERGEEEEEEAVAEKVGPDLFNVFPLSLFLSFFAQFLWECTDCGRKEEEKQSPNVFFQSFTLMNFLYSKQNWKTNCIMFRKKIFFPFSCYPTYASYHHELSSRAEPSKRGH